MSRHVTLDSNTICWRKCCVDRDAINITTSTGSTEPNVCTCNENVIMDILCSVFSLADWMTVASADNGTLNVQHIESDGTALASLQIIEGVTYLGQSCATLQFGGRWGQSVFTADLRGVEGCCVTTTYMLLPRTLGFSPKHCPRRKIGIGALSHKRKQKTNSVVWVCKQTIPVERPPLLGEVSSNFCW
jgi:hypothetical protein